jgi:outer membrane receptor protein involved in Fe transport
MKLFYRAGLTGWLLTYACACFSQQKTGVATQTKQQNEQDSLAMPVGMLQQLIISGNRTIQKRTEAPIAISILNAQTIKDTRANQLDQLLNKVTGVFMVDLGNEQHEMSIRQPMSTQGLFLYLEDGIPIRTTGIYNHNALLEMNISNVRQIEVIRGPASSLYGAEAIGGAVNMITQAPPAKSSGYLSIQGNNNGYKRADGQAGAQLGKWGVIASGYYANRTNGPIQYSDFHKTALTFRADYKASERLSWVNSLTYVNYYSDMYGSLDSVHFAQKNYNTPFSFTYRKVDSWRAGSRLEYKWSTQGESKVVLAYRNNSIGQNPSYYIKNNSTNPMMADGQINISSFHSFLMLLQHLQRFHWLGSKLVAGVSTDISPSSYAARYIRIGRDNKGNYLNYTPTDSLLSNYATGISNFASYMDFEMTPLKGLRAVAAVRYDLYHYDFRNYLPPSASSGAPDARNNFHRLTPKLGLTYNYCNTGVYLNYSQGYVPPQVTELYNGVKVPYLQPQTFYNYEAGGWLSILKNKLYADWSLYQMDGSNQIISVKQPDGSFLNQNSGKTRHRGVEYGITYRPDEQWTLRVSGSNADHVFVVQYENGKDYSGKQMAAAPHFIANAELSWRPGFLKGLRLAVEGQHLGPYFMDDANTTRYNGFDIFNFRAGYKYCGWEIWLNALNAFNRYYAALASKSSYGYSYNLGDPREVTVGLSWHFGKQ